MPGPTSMPPNAYTLLFPKPSFFDAQGNTWVLKPTLDTGAYVDAYTAGAALGYWSTLNPVIGHTMGLTAGNLTLWEKITDEP